MEHSRLPCNPQQSINKVTCVYRVELLLSKRRGERQKPPCNISLATNVRGKGLPQTELLLSMIEMCGKWPLSLVMQ